MENLHLLSKLTASKTSYAYQKAAAAILTPGNRIYVNSISGRGRFTSISNHLQAVTAQLDRTGVTYRFGNDAPKGGRMGDYVEVIHL